VGDELRAAEAYGAKTTGLNAGARFLARIATMRTAAGASAIDQVALDAQLRALLGDNVAQSLPLVPFDAVKDYEIFARMIARAVERHPTGVLLREFGALAFFWRDRGLHYPWLRRIGSIIFGIPEDLMDHALLTHLSYADAAHTGFSPTPGGTPTASAPGDSGAAGTGTTPSANDHKHAREAFGTTGGTVCQGNDARLSDARTPTAHGNTLHTTGVQPSQSAPGDTSSQGDSNAIARANHRHMRESFGSGAGDLCQGNDARLSDARTPTTHGNDKHSFIGSSFPGSPGTYAIFFHTSYEEWFVFDGTRWLSTVVRSITLNAGPVQPNNDAKEQGAAPRQPVASDSWIIAVDWIYKSDTAQSETKYNTYTLRSEPSATVLGSFHTKDATSANTWFGGRTLIGALTGTVDVGLALTNVRTNTPGNAAISATVRYRLVGV
jgi:hypothetical protein